MASSLNALVYNFKDHLKIPNNVVTWICKEDRTVIRLYCSHQHISVKQEFEYLNNLHKQYEFRWMKLQLFDVDKWISLNKNYTSMFAFTSRKQQ